MRTLTKGLAVVAAGMVLLPAASASAATAPDGGARTFNGVRQSPDTACASKELLRNGSFEQPRLARGSAFALLPDEQVPGWRTGDPAGQIKIWGRGGLGTNVAAPDGRQLAELNVTGDRNSLYQDIRTVPGSRLNWSLLIRARNATAGTDADTTSIRFTTAPRPGQAGAAGAHGWAYANTADDTYWKTLYGYYVVPRGQTWTRVTVASDSHDGEVGYGNLVDDVSVVKACAP
jgi:hypothetical protein